MSCPTELPATRLVHRPGRVAANPLFAEGLSRRALLPHLSSLHMS